VKVLARWEGVERLSRSKPERINLKILRSNSSGRGEQKRPCRVRVGEEREYSKTILLLFARARGLTKDIFFLLD
jgi:hypothetical protein